MAPTIIKKKCHTCKKIFTFLKGRTRKFCSRKCSGVYMTKVLSGRKRKGNYAIPKFRTFNCHTCNKSKTVPDNKGFEKVIYCSNKCRHHNIKSKLSFYGKRVKSKKDYYILIYIPDHPFSNAGYVLYHRYIVEKFLKKSNPKSPYLVKCGRHMYLNPKFVVHHINENKDDNYISNLYICMPSEHTRIHRKLDKVIVKSNLLV